MADYTRQSTINPGDPVFASTFNNEFDAIVDAVASKADTSDLTSHTTNTSNPHGVTKAQVGLGNVDNTSDLDKPISTATQTALDLKSNIAGTLTYVDEIPDAVDLNIYTATGLYQQSQNAHASTGSNYPEPVAGSLQVFAPTTSFIYQVYQTYHTGVIYSRSYYGGSWSPWHGAQYEAGAFTPTIDPISPSSFVPTYSAQAGDYIRIGNLVFVNVYIVMSSFTGSFTQIRIGGLPFNRHTATVNRSTMSFSFWGGLNLGTGYTHLVGFMQDTGNTVRLVKHSQTSGSGSVLNTDITGGLTLYGTMIYERDY